MSLHTLEIGGHRLKCPACGKPAASDKTFGVTVDHTGFVAQCFRCGHIEYAREQRQGHKPTALLRQPEPPPKPLSDYWQEVWARSMVIEPGSTAWRYLTARRCVIPPADGDLRWMPECKHPSGYSGPALVALLTDAETREPRTIHRTWIQADGTKAPIDPPRLFAAAQTKKGAVVRLWPDDEVTMGLGVAEGIESALSLAHAGMPVWACVDASNLAALPVLRGIESLTIARDRDPAGEKATTECARRWAGAGVSVFITNQATNDTNDLIKEMAV